LYIGEHSVKILGVRFKNLNSLMGEWQVDFTHPEYASNGIFAITGPTGAGKTTIMDAVCLGLYGRTPRLDKVTKSSNEIMSRQTGECFAEVSFETQKGRFRCHWSQHRARKKPDGELQQARHEIADADSGRVLESRIADVGKFIDEATGMDFERFTRSMLLAQGGFAVFLQAPPSERAPILEQITGTEIYSRISEKVHMRRTEERDKLELLQAELKGIQVLNADEEKDLQIGLKEKQGRETELAGKVNDMHKALTWLDGMCALEKELGKLDEQQQDFERRRQAFVPESEKLERARKTPSLEGDYRGVQALRTEQANDTKELGAALAALPAKDKAAADALAAKKTAEALLNEARTRQVSEADVFKKVRDLDARLGEQKKQLGEKDKAIGEVEKQGNAYKGHIENDERALKKSNASLEAVHEYRKKHAADAVLLTAFTAIARGFATIRDIEAKHIKACEALIVAAGKKESAIAASGKIETDHGRLRRELEKGQSELKRLTDEITAVLKGRDIGQWRSEMDALKDRERLLMQAGDCIERIDKAYAALDVLKAGVETLKASEMSITDEIKSCAAQKVLLEKDIGNLEAQVSILSRIRDLEEERKRLEDGKPCPLCGATDHPYAQGNVPVLNEAEAVLKKTKEEFKTLSETLSKLESGKANTAAEIRHTGKAMEEKKTAQETDEKQCAAFLSKLNIQATDAERAGKVQEDIAGVRVKIAETSGIVAAAEEKSKKEKPAQKALEKVRAKFDASGEALQDARLKLETAVLEHERLIKDCAALAEESEKARAVALKDVEPLGIAEIPSSNLDGILKDLKERKDAWQEKEDEKTTHEKIINDLKTAIEKNKALLGSLEEDLTGRRKERDDLKIAYESLCASRRELFGEKNADQEEKHLADAVKKAESTFERAREAYILLEKEIGALKEKIASLTVKTEKRASELAQAEQNIMARFKTAGFEDESGYLSSRLSEEERAILTEKENALIKEKTELETRRKDKSEALASEREKKLTDQSVEALKEDISACDAELKQERLDIGGIAKTLSENEKVREKQQERIKGIDARKKECARWDDLHSLIGSADGKKFRNFAQGLTFEMMTAHANRQLGKMTDRYLLIRDAAQPLELNVIDNYQAGEIRSTKNLSGGESFIVSLALALGLSHMASRNVRVDSLFLDEGFGTLDEDALETALETLAGLQQEGKLIGVISHVAALKERIGTQIQVVPETGGRSVLSGPGCRKI
jgi:DNA repair protein SbcC/Rad50